MYSERFLTSNFVSFKNSVIQTVLSLTSCKKVHCLLTKKIKIY